MAEPFFHQTYHKSSTKKLAVCIFGVLIIAGICAFSMKLYQSQPSKFSIQAFELLEEEFQDFINKYHKIYSTEEEYQQRLVIYKQNSELVRAHNSLNLEWTLGINEFSDMTFEEFKKLYLSSYYGYAKNRVIEEEQLTDIPTTVDWRTKGAVTAVQTQGPCESGYAFASVGAIESAWFLAGHTLTTCSAQEVLDCSKSYGNHQCAGGVNDFVFNFAIKNGLVAESKYPYTATNSTCKSSVITSPAVYVSKFIGVKADTSSALLTAVAKQPVAIAVEANEVAWKNYKSGIITRNCGTELDHSVLIVGYSNTTTNPYWIIKNSWGPDWGEKGYIRIAITTGQGVCGVNMVPSYPVAGTPP